MGACPPRTARLWAVDPRRSSSTRGRIPSLMRLSPKHKISAPASGPDAALPAACQDRSTRLPDSGIFAVPEMTAVHSMTTIRPMAPSRPPGQGRGRATTGCLAARDERSQLSARSHIPEVRGLTHPDTGLVCNPVPFGKSLSSLHGGVSGARAGRTRSASSVLAISLQDGQSEIAIRRIDLSPRPETRRRDMEDLPIGCSGHDRIVATPTRRASEGPKAFPSLARRVGVGCMQSDHDAL